MASVAAVLTVLGEPRQRLMLRFQELAAQEHVVSEVVVAAPTAEHASIRTAVSDDPPFHLRLVDNPSGERSAGLNLATAAATADLLVRIDARSSITPRHVALCAAILGDRPEVGVVGGPQLPVAGGEGLVARGIARALANPWALGGAAYRRARTAGPVDTVYLGAFRREELIAIGGYDERLLANEDFDLCQRYRGRGAIVWLHPDAAVAYEARTSLRSVAAQYFAFGQWKAGYWRLTGMPAQLRQRLALCGLAAGAVVVGWVLRRPRRAPGAGAVVVVALAVVDGLGARGQDVPPPARAVALCTYPLVWMSWTAGVLIGRIRGRQ